MFSEWLLNLVKNKITLENIILLLWDIKINKVSSHCLYKMDLKQYILKFLRGIVVITLGLVPPRLPVRILFIPLILCSLVPLSVPSFLGTNTCPRMFDIRFYFLPKITLKMPLNSFWNFWSNYPKKPLRSPYK